MFQLSVGLMLLPVGAGPYFQHRCTELAPTDLACAKSATRGDQKHGFASDTDQLFVSRLEPLNPSYRPRNEPETGLCVRKGRKGCVPARMSTLQIRYSMSRRIRFLVDVTYVRAKGQITRLIVVFLRPPLVAGGVGSDSGRRMWNSWQGNAIANSHSPRIRSCHGDGFVGLVFFLPLSPPQGCLKLQRCPWTCAAIASMPRILLAFVILSFVFIPALAHEISIHFFTLLLLRTRRTKSRQICSNDRLSV